MQPWQQVWREGIAPQLSERALIALRDGLRADDPALIEGDVVLPDYHSVSAGNRPAQGACLLGYCGWKGEGHETISAVEAFYLALTLGCNRRLGREYAWLALVTFWDYTPRSESVPLMILEVERTLTERFRSGHEASLAQSVS